MALAAFASTSKGGKNASGLLSLGYPGDRYNLGAVQAFRPSRLTARSRVHAALRQLRLAAFADGRTHGRLPALRSKHSLAFTNRISPGLGTLSLPSDSKRECPDQLFEHIKILAFQLRVGGTKEELDEGDRCYSCWCSARVVPRQFVGNSLPKLDCGCDSRGNMGIVRDLYFRYRPQWLTRLGRRNHNVCKHNMATSPQPNFLSTLQTSVLKQLLWADICVIMATEAKFELKIMQNLDLKGFQSTLSDAKSVVVLLPENPSLDSVAAATALSIALAEDGKEATVACPSPMLVEFNRLVGVQKVTDSIENRNLTVSFEDYEATNIERVSYNIENGKFMLVIAPKSGVTAPNKDQVILGYRGVAGDVVVVIGAEKKQSLGKFADEKELFGEQAKVVLVNNIPVSGFQNVTELINPNASSVSETVLQVVEGLNLKVNADVASNLFAGLRSGSDNFQTKITADTFAAASRLVSAGARIDGVNQQAQEKTPDVVVQTPVEQVPAEWTEEPKIFTGNRLP